MSDASSLLCWVRVVFLVLEDDFFINRKNKIFLLFLLRIVVLEISTISHEKVKKNK